MENLSKVHLAKAHLTKARIACALLIATTQFGCCLKQKPTPMDEIHRKRVLLSDAQPETPDTPNLADPKDAATPLPTIPQQLKKHIVSKDHAVATPGQPPAPPPVVDLWQPNEAQIARGEELILGLKNEINRDPTMHEMEKRLQTHMGLSLNQAQKIINAVKLLPNQD